MSDERKNKNEREPEFYELARRKPAPPDRNDVKRIPTAGGPSHTEDEPRREWGKQSRENEKTRLTPIAPKNGIPAVESVPTAPPEEEYELPKKPQRKFDLDLDDELKKIPDYTLAQSTVSARRRGWTVFAKLMFTLIILGISVLLSIVILFAVQDVFGFNKEDKEILVDIPQNAGLSQVADKLAATGVIHWADLFKAYYKFSSPGGEFQYGTYALNSKMSYDEIISTLYQYASHKEEVTVLFPEGTTLYEMAVILEEKDVCDAEQFLREIEEFDYTEKYEFTKEISSDPLKYYKLEGYLFPDTYKFYTNDDPVNVAGKMLRNFQNKFTDDLYARMSELGYTLEQTMTIASIVQMEAAQSADMKTVASVYSNRLKEPGKYPYLQADPTRKYAEALAEQMGSNVQQDVLNAYNTYEGKDLPPGPICNPGLDAIKAALYPDETNYYYFCNNLETKEFFYARTLEEHERNLVKAGLAG